jgi:hypothetical protein
MSTSIFVSGIILALPFSHLSQVMKHGGVIAPDCHAQCHEAGLRKLPVETPHQDDAGIDVLMMA